MLHRCSPEGNSHDLIREFWYHVRVFSTQGRSLDLTNLRKHVRQVAVEWVPSSVSIPTPPPEHLMKVVELRCNENALRTKRPQYSRGVYEFSLRLEHVLPPPRQRRTEFWPASNNNRFDTLVLQHFKKAIVEGLMCGCEFVAVEELMLFLVIGRELGMRPLVNSGRYRQSMIQLRLGRLSGIDDDKAGRRPHVHARVRVPAPPDRCSEDDPNFAPERRGNSLNLGHQLVFCVDGLVGNISSSDFGAANHRSTVRCGRQLLAAVSLRKSGHIGVWERPPALVMWSASLVFESCPESCPVRWTRFGRRLCSGLAP